MKKKREIDFAEPLMGDNYHSLEISLAKDSLADKAKGKHVVLLAGFRGRRCVLILSIKFKEKWGSQRLPSIRMDSLSLNG